jgi:hypothetical protein
MVEVRQEEEQVRNFAPSGLYKQRAAKSNVIPESCINFNRLT